MEDWKLAIEKYKRIPENDILRIFSFSIEQPINIKKIIYVCLILREEIIFLILIGCSIENEVKED